MTKTIKLALVAAMAMGATSAFATNGDALIGIGAKARGMGGVGIGMSHGAESALANPAMITTVKGTEISFGGTVFMPDVETEFKNGTTSYGSNKSDADMNVIPAVSVATELSDGLYLGVGMWGTAGMGVDHRDATMPTALGGGSANFEMVTNLQLMSFGVPIAYKTDGISIAFMPVLQYGALDIDYDGALDASNFAMGTVPVESGTGVAQDLAFGYTLGASYVLDDLTLGAVYKSAIKMDYKDALPSAGQPFANFGLFGGQTFGSNLEQPAEIGVGASYVIAGNTIAIDVKQIQWEDAEGYGEFGWEDQTVIAVGYEYNDADWSARAGYNYASNPIKEQTSAAATGTTGTTYADANAAALNMFNMLGFPGIVESHVTAGGTYRVSKQVSFDVAVTYALEIEETYSTAAFLDFGPTNPDSITTTHSQLGVSFAANFNF